MKDALLRTIACLTLITGMSLSPAQTAYAQQKQKKQPAPVTEERVYSVREIVQILKSRPEEVRGKTIKIKGYIVDTATGRGEGDFLVLTDREFTGIYQKDLWHEGLSRSERRKLKTMPIIRTGPALNMPQSVFPTVYGIYRGHFYDDTATADFRNGAERFIVEEKIVELGIDAQSPGRSTAVNKGLVIANGKVLERPYRVVLKDRVIRVNGALYQPATEQDIPRITRKTDDDRLRQWESLVKFLQEGWLVVYGGNRYESIVWRFPSTLVADLNAALAAPGTIDDKKKAIARLLDMPDNSPAIEDILKNRMNAPPDDAGDEE